MRAENSSKCEHGVRLSVIAAVFLVAALGLIVFMMAASNTAEAAAGSITVNSATLTLQNDADANGIANIGDTIRVEASITNADGDNAAPDESTVTVGMVAFGGGNEAMTLTAPEEGAGAETWRLDFLIVNGGSEYGTGSHRVQVKAVDADDPSPGVTMYTNYLAQEIDAIAPTLSGAPTVTIKVDNGVPGIAALNDVGAGDNDVIQVTKGTLTVTNPDGDSYWIDYTTGLGYGGFLPGWDSIAIQAGTNDGPIFFDVYVQDNADNWATAGPVITSVSVNVDDEAPVHSWPWPQEQLIVDNGVVGVAGLNGPGVSDDDVVELSDFGGLFVADTPDGDTYTVDFSLIDETATAVPWPNLAVPLTRTVAAGAVDGTWSSFPITVTDNGGNVLYYDVLGTFTIDNEIPVVADTTVWFPTDNGVIDVAGINQAGAGGDNDQIQVDITETTGDAIVGTYSNLPLKVQGAGSDVYPTGVPFTLDENNTDTTAYTFSVNVTDDAGNYIFVTTAEFSVDNIPPAIAFPATVTISTDTGVLGWAAINDGVAVDEVTVSTGAEITGDTVDMWVDPSALNDLLDAPWNLANGTIPLSIGTTEGLVVLTVTIEDDAGNWMISNPPSLSVDNDPPDWQDTVNLDADDLYKDGEVVNFETQWDGAGGLGYTIEADFSNIDSGYAAPAVTIFETGGGWYEITYTITAGNSRPDGMYNIPVTCYDQAGNGPIVDYDYDLWLDNTAPQFLVITSSDPDTLYKNEQTVTVIVEMDQDEEYDLTADFSALDDGYVVDAETVNFLGHGLYRVSYTITTGNTIPDGTYSIQLTATDSIGNVNTDNSFNVELDNTAPILSGDAVGVVSSMPAFFLEHPTMNTDADNDNDVCYFNDAPGYGNNQWIWVNGSFSEANPFSVEGPIELFDETHVDLTVSGGTFSLRYIITWGENWLAPGGAGGEWLNTTAVFEIWDAAGNMETFTIAFQQDCSFELSDGSWASEMSWVDGDEWTWGNMWYIDENADLYFRIQDQHSKFLRTGTFGDYSLDGGPWTDCISEVMELAPTPEIGQIHTMSFRGFDSVGNGLTWSYDFKVAYDWRQNDQTFNGYEYHSYSAARTSNITIADGGHMDVWDFEFFMDVDDYNGEHWIDIESNGTWEMDGGSAVTNGDSYGNPTMFYNFWVQDGGMWYMTDSGMEYCGYGDPMLYYRGPYVTGANSDAVLRGSWFRNNMYGLIVEGGNLDVADSTIEDNDVDGIHVRDTDTFNCDNNTIEYNGGHGINIDNSLYAQITNNYIYDNGWSNYNVLHQEDGSDHMGTLWTVDDPGMNGQLWHIVPASEVWYCGRDLTTTYDYGASIENTLTSPLIDGQGFDSVRMTFDLWFNTQPGVDRIYVEASNNGGQSWQTTWSSSGNNGGWTTYSLSHNSESESMLFRFRFVADDNTNNFMGVYLDNIVIEGYISDGDGIHMTGYEGRCSADILDNHIEDHDYGIYIEDGNFHPLAAPSGDHAWYIGGYGEAWGYLEYTFDLTGFAYGENVYMSFWHWYSFAYESGGVLMYYDLTEDDWFPLDPMDGYTENDIFALRTDDDTNGLDGFGRDMEEYYYQETGWRFEMFDLSAWAGESFTVQFWYNSYGHYVNGGWFIDDVQIMYGGEYWDFESGYAGWTVMGDWEMFDFNDIDLYFPLTTIDGNYIYDFNNWGIYAEYAWLEITNNHIEDGYGAIYLQDYCYYLIDGNNITYVDYGIYIYWHCYGDITNNYLYYLWEDAIYLEYYIEAYIGYNLISDIDSYGIYVSYYSIVEVAYNDLSFIWDYGAYFEGYQVIFDFHDNVIRYSDYGLYAYECWGLTDEEYSGGYYWAGGYDWEGSMELVYEFDLTAYSTAELTFWHAYNNEPDCDAGYLWVLDPVTCYQYLIYPEEDYDHNRIYGEDDGVWIWEEYYFEDEGYWLSFWGGMNMSYGWGNWFFESWDWTGAGYYSYAYWFDYYYGYGGYSDGWVEATYDLSMFAGQTIWLFFDYTSDGSVSHGGWGIDDVTLYGDGNMVFYDDCEGAFPGMVIGVTGWRIMDQVLWNYIVDNSIDHNDDYAIELDETTAYVYNNFLSWSYGIYIGYENVVWLEQNTITHSWYYGIEIDEYNSVDIINNEISYNDDTAIYINYYNWIDIIGNTITYNWGDGIYVEENCDIRIKDNLIAWNHKEDWYYGIYLDDIYHPPVITGNTITDNGYGIYIYEIGYDFYAMTSAPSGDYAWHSDTRYQEYAYMERSFNLAGTSTAALTFWQFYETNDYAGGNVQVFNETSGHWEVLYPSYELGDYHDYDSWYNEYLYCSPCYGYGDSSYDYEWDIFYDDVYGGYTWDGCEDGWIMATFNLSAYAGQNDVRLRFRWVEEQWSESYAGWFIDDITIYGDSGVLFYDDCEQNNGWTVRNMKLTRPNGYIANNEIMDHLGYGIELYYAGPDIVDNTITGNGYNGIYMEDQCWDLYWYSRPASPSGVTYWYSGYSNWADFWLYRTIDLTAYAPGDRVEFGFYTWYDQEDEYDGYFVDVDDGSGWKTIEPRGTYPDDMYWGSGYSYDDGDDTVWMFQEFDLSAFAGQSIDLRFRWTSDESSIYTGTYLDDFQLWVNDQQVWYDDCENGPNGWTSYSEWDHVRGLYGPPHGWSLVESNAMQVRGNTISNNGWDWYSGFYLYYYNNVIIEDNVINDNGVTGSWGPGIYLYYYNTVSIRNNDIRYNAYSGIYVDGESYATIIRDNTITNNYGEIDGETSGHGIYMYGYAAVIENNYIADNQYGGIYIEYGDYVIMRNTITGNHWNGIYLYEVGYYGSYGMGYQPTYLDDNTFTNNYADQAFAISEFGEDETGAGVWLQDYCYVHCINGIYSNNERWGIFVNEDNNEEFQWIIDGYSEVENNPMMIYSGTMTQREDWGGGQIYPVGIMDTGHMVVKNVRNFNIWLYDDDVYYGIYVAPGGTLNAWETTFDSWYPDSRTMTIPTNVQTFQLLTDDGFPAPLLDDENWFIGSPGDDDLNFAGGDSATIFAVQRPWGTTLLEAGEYMVNYATGVITVFDNTGSTAMTANGYDYKERYPFTFEVFGNLYMDGCEVMNTSLYIESPAGDTQVVGTEFHDVPGGIHSVDSATYVAGCYFHDIDFGFFGEGGTPHIAPGNLFEDNVDGVIFTGGAVGLVDGSDFHGNYRGVYVKGAFATITNCNFWENDKDGVHLIDGSDAVIDGNSFTSNGEYGIYVKDSTADIRNNDFSGEKKGVQFINAGGSTTSGNTYDGNNHALYVQSSDIAFAEDRITNSTIHDIYLTQDSDCTATNVFLDMGKVEIRDTSSLNYAGAPTSLPLPKQYLDEDTFRVNAIHLNDYFGDESALVFTWDETNEFIDLIIEEDGSVDIHTKKANWYGNTSIEITAVDAFSLTATRNLAIQVNNTNDPPTALNVELMPWAPTNDDDLTGSYIWTDNVDLIDTEQGTQIRWYKNGMQVPAYNDELTVPFSAYRTSISRTFPYCLIVH